MMPSHPQPSFTGVHLRCTSSLNPPIGRWSSLPSRSTSAARPATVIFYRRFSPCRHAKPLKSLGRDKTIGRSGDVLTHLLCADPASACILSRQASCAPAAERVHHQMRIIGRGRRGRGELNEKLCQCHRHQRRMDRQALVLRELACRRDGHGLVREAQDVARYCTCSLIAKITLGKPVRAITVLGDAVFAAAGYQCLLVRGVRPQDAAVVCKAGRRVVGEPQNGLPCVHQLLTRPARPVRRPRGL